MAKTLKIVALIVAVLLVGLGVGWTWTNWGEISPWIQSKLKSKIETPAASVPPASDPTPATTSATPANTLLVWFDTLGYYQAEGIKGISVDTRRPPYVAELAAEHLAKDYLDVLMKDAQEEMSRPNGSRKYALTAVTRVQIYLSEDRERLDRVFVYAEGTDPDGKPLAGKDSVTNKDYETGVMVYLSEVTWTPKKSSDFAREMLDAMTAKHGVPDRGEVFRHRSNANASKAVKITKK